jgi:serine/threonine protein kinase/FixJ family two-component response regulator
MAELYLALATGPGGFKKFVALKQIKPEAKNDERFVTLFLEEARISAALSHPGIGQVFDLGEDQGEFFIAMEFIEGQNLDEVRRACGIRHMSVPLGFSCTAVRDACLALHYAHHYVDPAGRPQPVVHRDVTPTNIMVTYEGNVKVVDFGLAKSLGVYRPGARPKTVRGTLGFMSPEQLRAEPPEARSDLYSAGVVLYELLTGEEFLRDDDEERRVDRILEGPIPRADALNPKVPSALADVIQRAISREPDDRFPTGKDMAVAIEDAARDLFDADQMSGVLRGLFRRRMDVTRALLARVETGEHLTQLGVDATALIQSGPLAEVASSDILSVESSVPLDADDGGPRIHGRGEAVLVVDDDSTVCDLVKICLEKQGYRAVGVTDPRAGLAEVEKESPDLVILDVMMPGLNGFDLCRQIREREEARHIPIVFLSGACSLEERVKALEVGGDDFIRKPFSPVELAARVRTHIDRVQAIHRAASRKPPAPPSLLGRLAKWFSPGPAR